MSMPVGLSLDGTFHLHYKGVANKDKTELVDAIRTFANQTINIVDCLLLAKAHSGKERLLSFDKDLNRLAKEVR